MKLLFGLAASAAVVYFLRTPKGKEFIDSLKKEYGSVSDTLFSLAENFLKKGNAFAGKTAEQASRAV